MKRKILLLTGLILTLNIFPVDINVLAEEMSSGDIKQSETFIGDSVLNTSINALSTNTMQNDDSADSAENPESAQKTYTISYGKGLYLSYNGVEPNNFIKGTPPEEQKVNENENVTVSENTFTFRDYTFGGWKYTYVDSEGKKQSKYYNAGDVLQNVSQDMKLEATWVKKEVELKIDAFAVYADTNKKSNHYIGEIVILKPQPTPPDSSYKFCGWTDNDGTVLYKAEDQYEMKYINTVIKPVWSKDGEQINYRKLSVKTKGKGTASVSEIHLLAGTEKEISFTANDGYKLSSLKINDKAVDVKNNITVKIENSDISVEAEFTPINPEIVNPPSSDDTEFVVNVIIKGGKGTASFEKLSVSKGGNATIEFTPASGYILPSSLTDNGVKIDMPLSENKNEAWDGKYTIQNITSNHVIEIEFVSKEGDTSHSEETSQNSNVINEDSKFTAKVIFIIISAGIIIGIIAVKLVNPSKPKKKKKTNKKNSKSKK